MTFKHGDVIDYKIGSQWHKGTYVAPNPIEKGFHIHLTASGFVSDRREAAIRKPKVKKEGWMNVYPSGVSATRHSAIAQSGWIYNSRQEAIDAQKNSTLIAIAVVKVEWEE